MSSLAQVEEVFRRWLYLPDPGALHIVLAAVAANRNEGDPVWVLLVGPPGGGKSEILNSLTGLPDVHPAATLTEAALLSGTPKRDTAADAKGGLLRVIGDFGIIVAKDFTSALAMNKDSRSQLLAALREIYDGAWTRHVGTDGGRTLHWHGKVGAVIGAMGERFIFYRLPESDEHEQARRSLDHAGKETRMRTDLAQAVAALLSNLDEPEPGPRSDEDQERLIELAILVCRARSAVERDSYTRDIELIPPPEAPTRLVVVLRRLLDGLNQIGVPTEHAWQEISKTALDSIPAIRLQSLLHLHATGPAETPTIAQALDYPTQTTRRALEDLTAHGLIDRTIRGEGRRADTWAISDFTETKIATISTFCVPGFPSYTGKGIKEEGLSNNDLHISPGITGTQPLYEETPDRDDKDVPWWTA